MDEINERISQVVEYSGLSKTEFAKRINLSQSMISKLCSGSTAPSDRTLSDICREFSINEMWLYTGDGDMLAETTNIEKIAMLIGKSIRNNSGNSIQAQFAAAIADTSEEDLRAFLRFAEKLLEASNKPPQD